MDSNKRGTIAKWCFWIGLVVASPLIYMSFHQGSINADRKTAEFQSHWHQSVGQVTGRGPYQGDEARASYRLVTLQYRDWEGDLHSTDRLMSWNTQVGQRLPMQVSDSGKIYVSADLNAGNKPTQSVRTGDVKWDGFWQWGPQAALLWILVWAGLYWLIIVVACRIHYRKVVTPATT